MKLLDGSAASKKILAELRARAGRIARETGRRPGLAVITVGHDPASEIYVRNKVRACAEVGIASLEFRYESDVAQDALLKLVARLNASDDASGILIQLPLPARLDAERIISAVSDEKDVDGFGPRQSGNMFLGRDALCPCTALGIIELLKFHGISLDGLDAVVIGRGVAVGRPVGMLLMRENATVTFCHSHTKGLAAHARRADLLVAAVGKPGFITPDMVKPGAILVDAGINRANGKLCGDADFDALRDRCSAITPVPGGVGPMTVAMLMRNTIEASERQCRTTHS